MQHGIAANDGIHGAQLADLWLDASHEHTACMNVGFLYSYRQFMKEIPQKVSMTQHKTFPFRNVQYVNT